MALWASIELAEGRRQGLHAAMQTAPELRGLERGEPALDEVQPRRVRRRDVDMEAGPFGEPPTDERRRVGPVVVHDDVDIKGGGNLRVEGIEECPGFHGPVASAHVPEDLPRLDIECRQQRDRPVPFVGYASGVGAARSALRRALHRGRHAVGSLGEPEELPPAHGAAGAASRQPRQSDGQFHGERGRNDTHESTTDPQARLCRKGPGREATLAYLGHVLLDNHHGLVANVCATAATGTAERDAAAWMLAASAPRGSTVGADEGYDTARFVDEVRALEVTPHIAQKTRYSAIDGRTTCHPGYQVSQRKRKLVEQVFGWLKTVGGLRKLRHRGRVLVDWIVTFAAAAYNLVRMRTLVVTCPQRHRSTAVDSSRVPGSSRCRTADPGTVRLP